MGYQLGFEINQDEFRGCAKTHGRTPSTGAAGGVDQETAETLQPIYERSVDARGDPGPREELTPVRVPGKLQGYAFLFRDPQLLGSMRQQNARALGVERSLAQNGAEGLGMNKSAMVHTDQVQAIKDTFSLSSTRIPDARTASKYFEWPENSS